MNVSPIKQIFKCFSCGAGGDAAKFVQLFDKVDYRKALEILAQRAGISTETSPEERESSRRRDELRRIVEWARGHFERNFRETAGGRTAYEYARRRGLTDTTLEKYRVGFAAPGFDDLVNAGRRAGLDPNQLQQAGLIGVSEQGRPYDRFRNRLMFPIADQFGQPIAFGGRTLDDDPAKYLNSPESALFSKSRVLYGLDVSRRAIIGAKAALVVEGYVDAITVSQAGVEHVVATLGTAMTESHVAIVKPYIEKLYLCFDSDRAGVAAVTRAVEIAIQTGLDVRVVQLEGAKDPADCIINLGPEVFNNYLHSAKDALHFKWTQTVAEFGGGPAAKRAAIEAFVQFVADITAARKINPLEQGLLLDRLSQALGYPADGIYELLTNARRASLRRRASGDEPAADDLSADDSYERATQEMPAGLVGAMEEILGLLAVDPACFSHMDDEVLGAMERVATWRRFYETVLNVAEQHGQYGREHVVVACDDSELLDVLQRVLAQIGDGADACVRFASAVERLRTESALEQAGTLRRDLSRARTASIENDDQLRRLLERLPKIEAALPPEYRQPRTPA